MRITHVVASLDPKFGGPPVVATCLAAGQAALGHSVQILSYHTPQSEPAIEKSLRGIPHMDQVVQVKCPWGGRLERFLATAVRRALSHHCADTQVFHLHGVWEPMLLAAASFSRRRGTPYVIMPHGMLEPWSLSRSRAKKRVALAIGYRRMLNDAAFLHVLNEEESRLIEPLQLTSESRIIPNGIFLEEFDQLPAAGSFRRLHPDLGDHPFILFMSRLHYKKGLDYLAHAMKQIASENDRIQLVVAGPDGGEEQPFRQLVRETGLTDRVHVVGPIYGGDKYAAMVDAACFCLPSRQEGFSIAILEAMACGTPVIITENCHFPEVGTEEAGIVVPLSADAVAAAMRRMLDSPSLRSRMGDNARELVRSRYTWPRIAERIISTYEEYVCDGAAASH